ncbi:MAG: uroporphyrinogen decarboxylase family protein [Chthoniobacteraceae bacterium]|nr:uroporphyrinogen decarboxylase family protein [Chthoniobacteraceae bacterium]
MSELTQKERLVRVLHKEAVDRPPVICTGGMMNAAIVEIMRKTGHTLPEAHLDADRMADLALDIHDHTGFENIGVPFCMTVEAELLGSPVDLGTLECEPKIAREIYPSLSQVDFKNVEQLAHSGRMNVVVDAAHRIAKARPDVPVIASLTGPVSTAASIVDPLTFYKELRKNPAAAHRVLEYVTNLLAAYAERVLESGASVIAIGDPSATGELLGPKLFEEYAVRYLNALADRVHAKGFPIIIHICGDVKRVKPQLASLHADALSTDAMISLPGLKAEYPHLTTMGNLSTFALQWSSPEKIATMARNLVADGIDIISPACGLSTSTHLESIRAMTDTVKATSPVTSA